MFTTDTTHNSVTVSAQTKPAMRDRRVYRGLPYWAIVFCSISIYGAYVQCTAFSFESFNLADVLLPVSGSRMMNSLLEDAQVLPTAQHSSLSAPQTTRPPEDAQRTLDKDILKVLDEYKRMHSVEALKRDIANNGDLSNRTFALGFYSCPYQAGNRMYHFLNQLLWAVVTNRTLLWKYYDAETCRRYNQTSCYIAWANSPEAKCNEILQRASWLPSFDEFAPYLSETQREPTVLNFWTINSKPKNPRDKRILLHDWTNESEKFSGVDLLNNDPHYATVLFPAKIGPTDTLANREEREYLLKTLGARDRATRLYEQGKSFLFGMLFRACFRVAPEIAGPPSEVQQKDTKTYALHSRHTSNEDLGFDITLETQCLEHMLPQNENTRCVVYLMSDRPATVDELKIHVERHMKSHCTVVTTSQPLRGTGMRSEHGPFAGAGFFRDLSMATNARDGLIVHTRRTSSSLLEDLIVYDRTKEAWERGEDYPSNKLLKCNMER